MKLEQDLKARLESIERKVPDSKSRKSSTLIVYTVVIIEMHNMTSVKP